MEHLLKLGAELSKLGNECEATGDDMCHNSKCISKIRSTMENSILGDIGVNSFTSSFLSYGDLLSTGSIGMMPGLKGTNIVEKTCRTSKS